MMTLAGNECNTFVTKSRASSDLPSYETENVSRYAGPVASFSVFYTTTVKIVKKKGKRNQV
jgi:hypothetical protein